MTTTVYWGTNIPGPWYKFAAGILLCGRLFSGTAAFAAESPANARLTAGIAAYRTQNYAAVVTNLSGLQTQFPKLSDYVVLHLASAELQVGDADSAIRDLNTYRLNPVAGSPNAGKINLLLGRALLVKREAAATAKSAELLTAEYKTLPQPDGDFTLAMAYEAQGEALQSAMVYQRVYYGYPNTAQAVDAWTAMQRLQVYLATNYPRVPARQQLERCEKWLAAKEYRKAGQEYEALSKTLPEPERDEARVGLGASMQLGGETAASETYLKNLHVGRGESDAKRLYYLTEATRKSGDDASMAAAVKALGLQYGKSVWRLKALVTAGNRYLLTNDREIYAPLYKAASDGFPEDNSTAYCHWKFTWDAYLANKGESGDLLREQVERYPGDSRASTALYFLGRLAEAKGAKLEARVYYDRLSAQYPHYYYSVLARDRVAQAKLVVATEIPASASWLDQVAWPAHKDLSAVEPNPATKQRMERARLLYAANLPDLAEAEIRFGAKSEGEQPHLLALEMAKVADSPFRALRVMKSFSADYLSLPISSAPKNFWQMLFPLPYKDHVFRFSKEKDLDPYYVAALIRQESEFNPVALSRVKAYGLMQLMPSTGKMLGKQEGVAVATPAALFNPQLNIQLGTHYLRGQLNTWSGNWEETLAAYNAGPGRVKQWLGWGTYREPAEFVESIPFTETREYVQAVLRNADMYRQIYGSGKSGSTVEKAEFLANIPEYRETRFASPNSAPKPAVTRMAVRRATAVRHSATSAAKHPAARKKIVVSSKKANPTKKHA